MNKCLYCYRIVRKENYICFKCKQKKKKKIVWSKKDRINNENYIKHNIKIQLEEWFRNLINNA